MRKRHLFTVDDSERERILNLHENATRRQYLDETMDLELQDEDITNIISQLEGRTGASEEAAETAVCKAPEIEQEFESNGLGELLKKIKSLDLSKLIGLFKEVKAKKEQPNSSGSAETTEQAAAAAAGTMILGVPVSYILLGLVALGVLTAILSRIGGGGRGYSSGKSCRATRRARAKGQGIWGSVRI